MASDYTIYTAQLVKHLKINKDTVSRWVRLLVLFPRYYDSVGNRYSSSDVDAFLARETIGFETPPTFKSLLSGELVIATPVEAAALLNLSTEGVWGCLRRGHLRAFRLEHEYRYDLASLQAYAAKRDNTEFIPLSSVEHVLGVSRRIVKRLIEKGLLVDASDTYRRRVTRTSLLELLATLLPSWIDPRDWIEDRNISKRRLLTPAAMAINKDDQARIEILLDSGKVQFIHNPYGRAVPRLVSPESWFACIQRTEKELSKAAIAKFFGVTRVAVHAWRQKYPEYFACHEHDHIGDELYPTCLHGILRRNLTTGPSRSLSTWCTSVIERGLCPITAKEAARILRQTEKDVVIALESNKLFGLRTPSGGWMVSYASARSLRASIIGSQRAARPQ